MVPILAGFRFRFASVGIEPLEEEKEELNDIPITPAVELIWSREQVLAGTSLSHPPRWHKRRHRQREGRGGQRKGQAAVSGAPKLRSKLENITETWVKHFHV
jgi:hypothetical protein